MKTPIAVDKGSIELFRIAERVAATDATVTISGESGCGKEVIARFIHGHSKRHAAPFVAINCAAIPENMLEAVLFGYEKGAFTGAAGAHPGKFEQAQHGTLLLDEVSEMDLGLQAKLLRVLQEKEVERLGGRATIALDVRVLATTNRDLRRYVASGSFREDLYYRLNVFPLHVLPLRQRRDDIVPLAESILERFGQGVSISAGAAALLESYDWPGNVRELENLVQRSLILLNGDTLTADALVFDVPPDIEPEEDGTLQRDLKKREYELIVDAMKSCGGKRSAVAAALNISPRTLRYKLARMRELGIALPTESNAAGADAALGAAT